MKSNQYHNLQAHIKEELGKFGRLNPDAKLRYVSGLLTDYEDANSRAMNAESASFKTKYPKKSSKSSESNKSTAKKKKINSALLNKTHAAIAGGIIVSLGYLPWVAFFGMKTVAVWTPFFSSVQFITGATVALTWVVSEIEHISRKWRE